jgi:hypothetical protein
MRCRCFGERAAVVRQSRWGAPGRRHAGLVPGGGAYLARSQGTCAAHQDPTRPPAPEYASSRVADWTTIIAAYAAGVSSLVGLQTIFRDLPQVKIQVREGAHLIDHRADTRQEIVWVTVVNAGRRPVRIQEVSWLVRDPRYSRDIPSVWVDQIPKTALGEGQSFDLTLDAALFPKGSTVVARDNVGRWWPRRRRITVWRHARHARHAGDTRQP